MLTNPKMKRYLGIYLLKKLRETAQIIIELKHILAIKFSLQINIYLKY